MSLEDIKQRKQRADDELDRLTAGSPGTNWRWSIPANPERDSDLILADSVADIPKLVAALEAVEQFASEMRDSEIAHDRAIGKVLRGMITGALA